jgi:LysM repeat protein
VFDIEFDVLIMDFTTEKLERGRSVDQLTEMLKIPLKIRLIKQNSQTSSGLSEGGFREHNQVNKGRKGISKRFSLCLLARFISATLFLPYFSYAATFPILSLPILNSEERIVKTQISGGTQESFSSQNIEVLSPIVYNNQVKGAVGGGRITVVDDRALSPEVGVVGTALDIEQTQNNGKISIYEVRDGDTLSQIAEMFDISANTIRWANDLSGAIQPGQILVILPVTGITHKVKSGGTIADIAKIYNADVREIALFNGIEVDAQLEKGDEIIVPNVDPVVKDDSSSKSGSKTKLTQPYVASYSGPAAPSGYYMNPVPGAILTQNLHGYNAVDFGAPTGTPVYASATGRVIDSRYGGWNGGYALMIIISHDNGTQTLYAHLSENMTKVGQKVKKGEIIGRVGSTGNSTGPHLHFEVRGAKNPMSACKAGSVCSI